MGNKQSQKESTSKFEREFDIVSAFGRGTFGCVYYCKDKRLGHEYAVKTIRLQTDIPHHDYRKLIGTAHRNTVRIIDIWIEHPKPGHEFKHQSAITENDAKHGVLFLQLEYCNYKSLRQWLESDEKSLSQAINLMVQISQGLAYLHSHEIAHKNLTPENVLLHKEPDGKLTAKVGDFGVINEILDYIQEGHHAGYFPNRKESSLSADVYSFAVVASEMVILCGESGGPETASWFYRALLSGSESSFLIQDYLSSACNYKPLEHVLMKNLKGVDKDAKATVLAEELLRIFPAEFTVGYGDFHHRWSHIMDELNIPFKYAALRGIYLNNIGLKDRIPHLRYDKHIVLPSLEEYELHLKCNALAPNMDTVTASDIQTFVPDIRQLMFFRQQYKCRVKITFNGVTMLGFSPGQIVMSYLPGSICTEIIQQLSMDYVHPLISLALYKCGNIEWFGIQRPFLQPLKHFVMVQSGTLIEDRVKNLFTDLHTFIYWGCGSLAYPNEILEMSKSSLKRIEMEINAPNDRWSVYFDVQEAQLMVKGFHESFVEQFVFPNAKKVIIFEATEMDTSSLLKSLIVDLGTSFSYLEWLAWLNFYYDENRWTPSEQEELRQVLSLRLSPGINHFLVTRTADYTYMGSFIDDPKNHPTINAQIDDKLGYFYN